MNYLIITNNPRVKEEFENVYFVEGLFEDVMVKSRDFIHKGYELIAHPLGASIRMFFSPYHSVVVSQHSKEINSFHVEIMENSIINYRNVMGNRKADIKNAEDYSFIDLQLLKSTLKTVRDNSTENFI